MEWLLSHIALALRHVQIAPRRTFGEGRSDRCRIEGMQGRLGATPSDNVVHEPIVNELVSFRPHAFRLSAPGGSSRRNTPRTSVSTRSTPATEKRPRYALDGLRGRSAPFCSAYLQASRVLREAAMRITAMMGVRSGCGHAFIAMGHCFIKGTLESTSSHPASHPSRVPHTTLLSQQPPHRTTVAMETTAPAQIYPIQAFFANYPEFDYDAQAPFFEEFRRLEADLHWERKQREIAREELRDAMVRQFNSMYGTSADDLASWQLLCTALGMSPIPNDIKSCQRKVKATHVNLVDFIEAPLTGKPVQTFKSEAKLSKYTQETKKYFPRDNVNSGSLLRCLLRQIMNPNARRPPGKFGRREEATVATMEPVETPEVAQ
ncbi:hypothetical protein OH77DRAFT_216487 [Trametes cingulata]|nr:hypothetical protein OH77DRAFT_216487 [Trametes cingulata]